MSNPLNSDAVPRWWWFVIGYFSVIGVAWHAIVIWYLTLKWMGL